MGNTIRTYAVITLEELINHNDDYNDTVCFNKLSRRFKSLKEYYHYYTKHENKLYLLVILFGVAAVISASITMLVLFVYLKYICEMRNRRKKAKMIKKKIE